MSETRKLIVVTGPGHILVDDDEGWVFPVESVESLVDLGEFDSQHFFASYPAVGADFNGRSVDFRNIDLPDRDPHWRVLSRAIGLRAFMVSEKFSPYDGALMSVVSTRGEVSRRSDSGVSVFPRKDPVVICLVLHPEKGALLINNLDWNPLLRSPISGYVDVGESVEDAARREVLEEVGLVVDDVRYVCSGPWPQPNTLTLGLVAYLHDDTDLVIEDAELRHAGWYTTESLSVALRAGSAAMPPRMSVGRRLVDAWLEGGFWG